MSQAEQTAYDAGMTKAIESFTAQLKDIARAFYLEVWGQALSASGVGTNSEFRAPKKVYYLPALRLAPTPHQHLADSSSVPSSSSDQSTAAPSTTPS